MSNRPNAAPRRSGGDIARTSATDLVDTSAPLTAWKTRDRARSSNDGAAAARSDASAKASTPTRKTRRWPNLSPRLPLAGNATVTAPRYSVTSDETVSGTDPNSPMTLGNATASIVELSGTSTAPLATRAWPGRAAAPGPRSVTGGGRPRVVPSISTSASIGDPGGRVAGADDRRQPELSGTTAAATGRRRCS